MNIKTVSTVLYMYTFRCVLFPIGPLARGQGPGLLSLASHYPLSAWSSSIYPCACTCTSMFYEY